MKGAGHFPRPMGYAAVDTTQNAINLFQQGTLDSCAH